MPRRKPPSGPLTKPLALTMGDPAGIGGEIAGAAWRALRLGGPSFMLLGDPGGLGVPTAIVDTPDEAAETFAKALPIVAVPLAVAAQPGQPDPANAQAVIASIVHAVRFARAGEVGGIVTNPISKATLYGAGFEYPGHTEFLGALTGCANPVMMLANAYLRVVPVTVHLALRRAVQELSTDAIVAAGRTTASSLVDLFGVEAPRLAIAGLNPHAGEGGAMGDEEDRLIRPAIEVLRADGIAVTGPWPPDTMFTPSARASYDAAICMYHDQALIPLKTLDMASGINVTLGLPIVRTSPDHGTAFDIAGTGRADPSSLIAAIRLAGQLAARRGMAS